MLRKRSGINIKKFITKIFRTYLKTAIFSGFSYDVYVIKALNFPYQSVVVWVID